MAVIEKLDQLKQGEESERQRWQAFVGAKSSYFISGVELERRARLEMRRINEMPEHFQAQALLLEELRSLGVVGMLEEGTGIKIERIGVPQKKDEPGVLSDYNRKNKKELKAAVDRMREERSKWSARKWDLYVTLPKLSESGRWDDTLNIILTKRGEASMRCHGGIVECGTAVLSYSPEKVLTVGMSDGEVTYQGKISDHQEHRTEFIGTAIAQAIYQASKPKIGVSRGRYFGRLIGG